MGRASELTTSPTTAALRWLMLSSTPKILVMGSDANRLPRLAIASATNAEAPPCSTLNGCHGHGAVSPPYNQKLQKKDSIFTRGRGHLAAQVGDLDAAGDEVGRDVVVVVEADEVMRGVYMGGHGAGRGRRWFNVGHVGVKFRINFLSKRTSN